ncbi:MAG: secretin N-terminal domain-containing protein [Sedimentisphaerales bacterium]|jgi:type II secretory pathway component GspD/PulD (secretin)
MAIKLRPVCRTVKFAFFALLIFGSFTPCQPGLAADLVSSSETAKSVPDRYRAFLLRYISPQKAKQFLADVNITSVSQLNDSNTLLVTAGPDTLLKVAGLLTLADSREEYAVKVLLPASEANRMPSVDAMAAEIGRISIGTFSNIPGGTGYKAIVDTYEGKLIAVAPVAVMDKFVGYADIVKRASPLPDMEDGLTSQPVAESGPANPDRAFDELLDSISKAESNLKSTGAVKQQAKQPKAEGVATKPQKQTAKDKITGKEKKAAEPNLETESTEPNKEEKVRNQYEPEYMVNADETLELALPEKLDVISLLDLVGKYLNLNYVYDPKLVQGKEVYLKVQGPIKVRELYPLAESVLKFTGLVMTRKGNLVTIVPLDNAMEIDPTLIETGSGQVQAGDVVVTRVFQLNYIDTANARALLEGMKVGAITEIAARGTLIVTGYAYRMNRVEQLLDVIDKPGTPKQFKFRQLKYTMANTLAPKIKALVEQLGDMSIAISATPKAATPQPVRRPPVRQPTPAQPTPAAAATGSSKPSIYLDADERTNRILMIGQEEELTVVENLIDALDIAQQDLRSLRVYEMQHVDAEEVRKKLEELGIIGASKATTTTSGRITARTAAPAAAGQPAASPTPAPMTAPGSEGELPSEELQVVVIEATNSLMVNASPEQHALIATIISYVDSESEQKAIPYKVYPLQNQSPDHIAEVIKKLIEDVVKDKEGKIEKVVKKTEDNIIVVPDANTFSLIVYANKKNQDWIADLIKTLDKRRPQVLIDVTLVEVTNTESFDLDLEMASKFPKMIPGVSNLGFLPVVDSNSLGSRRKEAFVSKGQGLGFYSDEHIQALLTAVQSKKYGRVLAKPKILVNDGQVGIIKTADTVNVQLIGSTVVAGQTSGNAIQTSTSYQPYNDGITLTIQPNIGEGDLLLLIVKLERSDFVNVTAGQTTPPNTTSSNIDTTVTVPNNKTIILGGLLKLNQGKGGSKVPLLGDIPLVGALFRSTSDSVTDSKLYVFVKANILRPETTLEGLSEIEKISEKNRAAFEKYEEAFQKYDDVPGVKPQPVDPLKVLDAE